MVIGHYALAFGLKKLEPRISLGMLMLGVALADIVLGFTLLSGLEHAEPVPGKSVMLSFNYSFYPYTHSLAAAAAWALAGFLAYLLRPTGVRSGRLRPAVVFAFAILSHVLLDMIAHTPDITLAGGSTARIGLGFWKIIPATAIVELAMFVAGLLLYTGTTRTRSAADRIGLAALIVIALGFHVWGFSLFLIPSVTVLALMMLFLQPAYAALGWYVDTRRSLVSETEMQTARSEPAAPG